MAAQYSDVDIEKMVNERKVLPEDYGTRLQLRDRRGHKERELDIDGASGNKFRVILRQSLINPLDFSIILVVRPPQTNQLFRLRRYNGRSHEHTNRIEGERFYDFHIHMATERYQELGMREDTYARPTARFGDFHAAQRCMWEDCGFSQPEGEQQPLFREVSP
jgi:hypothetical protein